MNDDIDDIKKELEEVRKLKEELKREVDDTKRRKDELQREKSTEQRYHDTAGKGHPKQPHPPRRPRHARPVKIDLSGITDSLEDMMDDLGRSIEMSIKDIDGFTKDIRIPGVRIKTGGRKGRVARRKEIENIPPERIAKIVAPLGSEERLRILDYLKTGGKSFNDIENFTGKTGSSLTHHLNPLLEAGYVVKGEVRGTYYVTVEGRLAYRLAQWLTHRVEQQQKQTGNNGEGKVEIEFDESTVDDEPLEEEVDLETAAEHLERVSDQIESVQDKIEDVTDLIEEAQDTLEDEDEDDDEDDVDVDDFDWED